MSVAFTKEGDSEAAAADLPDRPVSAHPNHVTALGLAAIDAALAAAQAAFSAAQASAEIGTDRTAMARASRDLRYWTARRASARLVEPGIDDGVVRFGSRVTFTHDGVEATLRIVGEDEADPAAGSVAYPAPAARALMGKTAGDTARWGGRMVEVTAVSAA